MFEFDQYLGFLAFLSVLTIGFWLMIFLLTFVIPYWLVGAIIEHIKYGKNKKRIKKVTQKSFFLFLESKFTPTTVTIIGLISFSIVFTLINFIGKSHYVGGPSPLKFTIISKKFCDCRISISTRV